MRWPFVSRKRYEAVKAERDRLRKRAQAGEVTVRLRADTSEFDAAMDRVMRTTGVTADEIERFRENVRKAGEHR